jgi:hypothetical protein
MILLHQDSLQVIKSSNIVTKYMDAVIQQVPIILTALIQLYNVRNWMTQKISLKLEISMLLQKR